jgi:hypothetical protein
MFVTAFCEGKARRKAAGIKAFSPVHGVCHFAGLHPAGGCAYIPAILVILTAA